MNHSVFALLADQADRERTILEALRMGFRTSEGDTGSLILAGVLVCLILGVYVLVRRSPRADDERSAVDLLGEAVELLQLSEQDRRDLRLLAQSSDLDMPVALLLTPSNLAHGVRQAIATRPDPQLIERMRRLSQRHFGEPLPLDPGRAFAASPSARAEL